MGKEFIFKDGQSKMDFISKNNFVKKVQLFKGKDLFLKKC
jgi:hypothetical protein